MRLVKTIDYWQNLETRNDPRTMRWCRQNKILGEADQRRYQSAVESDPTLEMFGIEVLFEGASRIVGTCGLTSVNYIHSVAEYSMLIFPEHRGLGYAKDAMRLLLDYGFYNLGLAVIWGEILVGNDAGRAIARRLGFTEEARLRARYFKEGRRIDTFIVSMLAEEWTQLHEFKAENVKSENLIHNA